MRRNNKVNPNLAKINARKRYAERKIDTWWKWSFKQKGKVLYRELIEVQKKYGIDG